MLKEKDKIYSWYTHREGTIISIGNFESCIVKWEDDKNEQKVPIATLRKFPTKTAIYNELKYAYRNNIQFDKLFPVLEKEYGDRVLAILDDTLELFKVRQGDQFTNGKKVGFVVTTNDQIAELQFRDNSKERIQKRELILGWKKLIEENLK